MRKRKCGPQASPRGPGGGASSRVERSKAGASLKAAPDDSWDHSRDAGWLEGSEGQTQPGPGWERTSATPSPGPLTAMAVAQQLRAER